MSTPVVTDKWAGIFDCDFCRRKRLQGDEFSKKALERFRRDGGKLKCKQCVVQQEQVERAAAAKKQETSDDNDNNNETRKCAICSEEKKYSQYNKNQWNKGEGKSKCRPCVEKAIADEASAQSDRKANALQEARDALEVAKKSGNSVKILAAESQLAALEAEKVTGLKPVRMNRGSGGRGRGRGSSTARGRGRGGRGRR